MFQVRLRTKLVFVSTLDGYLSAVDPVSGIVKWHFKEGIVELKAADGLGSIFDIYLFFASFRPNCKDSINCSERFHFSARSTRRNVIHFERWSTEKTAIHHSGLLIEFKRCM